MDVEEKIRENRLRRMARRQGLELIKSRTRDPWAVDYGSYTLIDLTPMWADLARCTSTISSGSSSRRPFSRSQMNSQTSFWRIILAFGAFGLSLPSLGWRKPMPVSKFIRFK